MILFFSATGNTRFAAEQIGNITGDQVVNLLPLLRDPSREPLRSDRPWVIAAPIYVESIPPIVADWLRAARLEGSRQVYCVFTTASTMGSAGYAAGRIVRKKGLEYMGSAPVRMPTNYPLMFTVRTDDENRRIIRDALPSLRLAAGHIARGEPIPEKPFSPLMAKLFDLVGAWFYRWYIRPDRFHASDKCLNCGKCARLCPTGNIRMVDGRPAWGAKCVHCMGCVSGCPVEAVEYGRRLAGKRRYHFPKDL